MTSVDRSRLHTSSYSSSTLTTWHYLFRFEILLQNRDFFHIQQPPEKMAANLSARFFITMPDPWPIRYLGLL